MPVNLFNSVFCITMIFYLKQSEKDIGIIKKLEVSKVMMSSKETEQIRLRL